MTVESFRKIGTVAVASAPTSASPPAAGSPAAGRVTRGDLVVLAAFSALLFGYGMFSGRPLSLHEARLPECAREMLATGELLFPTSGGRPWLERPPLPHWVEIGTSLLFGRRCDAEWVVRLPAAAMGLLVVLLTARTAAAMFGRPAGMIAGLALATTYEFYAYATLAEDDVFLAAVVAAAVAVFVDAEVGPRAATPDPRVGFAGNRPWRVWAFYLLLGLTNWAKGPLLGAAVVVGPVVAFLLWDRDGHRARRYAWLWGWLLFAGLAGGWTLAAHARYPDISRNLLFDYDGTSQYDQPVWYYPLVLLGLGMPWVPFAVVGLLATRRAAVARQGSAERFLWCWAVVPILVLSVPHRKHHHYLVPSLAPWAALAAVGLAAAWRDAISKLRRPARDWVVAAASAAALAAALVAFHRRLPVPARAAAALAATVAACAGVAARGVERRRGALTAAACFVGVGVAYCWGQHYLPDLVTEDTAFLRRAEAAVPLGDPLFVNGDLAGELDFFRNQFYLRPQAVLLHNLTYLRDDRLEAATVWVVTRARDVAKLRTLGDAEAVDRSARTRRERSPDDRFTLFKVRFRPELVRYPRPVYVTTLQAMGREKGPYCGPPF